MKCIDSKIKKMVSLYQFNLLDEQQRTKVEAHLLECDACFQELYQLSPVVENLLEMPECFTDALKPRPTHSLHISKYVKDVGDIMKKEIDSFYSLALLLWKKSAFKIIIPAMVAVIVISFLVYLPGSKHDTKFAVKDSASYLSQKLRGWGDAPVPHENLLNQGIKDYQEQRYKQAIPNLQAYLQKKKNDPYGHFYLGASLLHTDEYKKAINHLKTASGLCQKQGKELLLEKCHWYLGNAYVKIDDSDSALSEFYKVIEIKGEFAEQARNQITTMNEQKEQ